MIFVMSSTSPLPHILEAKRNRAVQMRQAAAIDATRASAANDLAELLPRAIESGLQAQASNGELVERFKTAMEISAKHGLAGDEQLRGALFAVMREQGVRSGRFLAEKGTAWLADAHRAEGAAGELEQIVQELANVASPPSSDVAPGSATASKVESTEEAAEESPTSGPTSGEDCDTNEGRVGGR
jgi:hypothetical protein